MELVKLLHMNKGEGATSYAKNSVAQEFLSTEISSESIGIADLGCSSGPNALLVLYEIVTVVFATYQRMGYTPPELRVSLNDLFCNDFNDIFQSLPAFYDKFKNERNVDFKDRCFISGVPGSFYGRLFAKKSLHFVHSSSTVHWLSQGLVEEEKIDSLNVPYYAPSLGDLKHVVQTEGSFSLDRSEIFESDWSKVSQDQQNYELETLSSGNHVAKSMRAAVESVLASHFGREIMDELFLRYGNILDDQFSKSKIKFISLIVSLKKKGC